MTRDTIRPAIFADERGAAALVFALALPMLLGFGALVTDIGNARVVEGRMQGAADAAALAAVQDFSDRDAAVERALSYARQNVPESYGDVIEAEDVVFGSYDPGDKVFVASETDVNAVRISLQRSEARDNALHRFLSVMMTSGATEVSVSAVAARFFDTVFEKPILKDRGVEAWDYNEIYVYCYDSDTTKPIAERRTQMTLIHRNITPGVDLEHTAWPECAGEGKAQSFRLRNIRDKNNARDVRSEFQAGKNVKNTKEYNHYTDTVRIDGRDSFSGLSLALVETKRCASEDECKKISQGGILEEGRNRTPVREERPCIPGSYIYYGWEDRPPEWGGSDRDYDDITFILKCTASSSTPMGGARLVR